jgi:hypothetical protein
LHLLLIFFLKNLSFDFVLILNHKAQLLQS